MLSIAKKKLLERHGRRALPCFKKGDVYTFKRWLLLKWNIELKSPNWEQILPPESVSRASGFYTFMLKRQHYMFEKIPPRTPEKKDRAFREAHVHQ